MNKIRILAIAMLLIGVSLIGTGYAYQSSYESQNNTLEGQYVTLNYGVESSSLMNYTQHYDTFVNGTEVTYSVPLPAGEIRQKLTSTPYEITITENKETTGYRLLITSDLPTLYASSTKSAASWCQFMFVLSKDNVEYYGLTELANGLSKNEYRFYKAIDDDESPIGYEETESLFTAGTYKMDVYLVMHHESTTRDGISGVPVDKTNFVDAFNTPDFTIKFTVLP